MSSASVRFGTKAYVCARYFLRPGKCFKYIDQCGEDATEHVYEVMALYPYCVLLRDTRNGVRTCPGYNRISPITRENRKTTESKISRNIATVVPIASAADCTPVVSLPATSPPSPGLKGMLKLAPPSPS